MIGERGTTLIEVLIFGLVGGLILLAAGALYVATARALDESSSQVALQQQGTLVLDELGREVRSAATITTETCNGHAGSLLITNGGTTHCYYVGSAGELCQYSSSTCRNLLAGALRPHVPGSQAALTATGFTATLVGTNRADVAFTITDGLNTPMTFNVSLTCGGRGC